MHRPAHTRTHTHTRTHAHTHTQCTRISSFHIRVSSVRGCKNGESLKRVLHRGCVAVQQWSQNARKTELGFPSSCMALAQRNATRDHLPDRATLNAQSTRHGARAGLKLASSVHAGPLCAPQPRARGKTPGRERNRCRCDKQALGTYTYEAQAVTDKQLTALFIYPTAGQNTIHSSSAQRSLGIVWV